jgi:ubiquinone/menaquinone biosynthesis C-methylase UbiE
MADKYLFDNAAEKEAFARMMALSALHDAATRRYIEERDIAPGWKCLEIGAGEGSVARWRNADLRRWECAGHSRFKGVAAR